MDLIWWIEQAGQRKSRPIRTSKLVMTLESDASNLGWGALRSVSQDSTAGVWNRQERSMHINGKELLAAWLGLRCYASNMRNAHIHLRIDNTTAVAHINKMGPISPFHWQDILQLHNPHPHTFSDEEVKSSDSS